MSTQNREVENRFKFGGVEFSITTDDVDNPASLVSMQKLITLIQQLEPFLQLELFDGIPTVNAFDAIPTVKCVYEGLCKIAKDIDTLEMVTLPLAPNIFYGTRTSALSSATSAYLNCMYVVSSSSGKSFYYHTGTKNSPNVKLTPQRGRTYYNAGPPSGTDPNGLAKGWYLWNGSDLVALDNQ